jgi:hypothetical protein
MRRFAFATLVLIALSAAHDARAASACPSPTVPQGSQCVLDRDVVLAETLVIPSGTKLNCKGHRLTPSKAGALDEPRTPLVNEFVASKPELAMFVHKAYGVKIQNCVISGFDFGIMVAQSKTPAGATKSDNKILGNTIDVRTNAIDVIKSDGVIISDNRLTYASERGRGVVLDFDSDENQILNNTITSSGAASTGQVRQVPLGPMVTGTAVMDNAIHCLQSDKSIQTFVVNGVLVQVTTSADSPGDDSDRTDNNLIEGNDIFQLSPGPSCTSDPDRPCRGNGDCADKDVCLLKQNSGIGFNIRAADTIVRSNRISGGMERGVSFGGVGAAMTVNPWFPGHCSLDASRQCASNAECFIAGFDLASKGVCEGAKPHTLNGNTVRLTAESNTLSGTYASAAFFANNTDTFVFRGNIVEGGASGIRINNTALNGVIERNIVSGATDALYLGYQPTFTQTIRLNDFTDYSVAIRTSNDFTPPTDISAAGRGNYWGRTCADDGFDASRVLFDNGRPNPNVADEHPYGRPVARTPDERLPDPCR